MCVGTERTLAAFESPKHLQARLRCELQHNYWGRPLCVSASVPASPRLGSSSPGGSPRLAALSPPDGRPRRSSSPERLRPGADAFSLISAENYLPFHVPVELSPADQPAAPVCELPQAFSDALERHAARLRDFSQQVVATTTHLHHHALHQGRPTALPKFCPSSGPPICSCSLLLSSLQLGALQCSDDVRADVEKALATRFKDWCALADRT